MDYIVTRSLYITSQQRGQAIIFHSLSTMLSEKQQRAARTSAKRKETDAQMTEKGHRKANVAKQAYGI
jgi:hypothetical protein